MPQGYLTFNPGQVLTSVEEQTAMDQVVLVYATAAARDAAVTSPLEGQFCYVAGTVETLTYYDGAAWQDFGGGSPEDENTVIGLEMFL
jgi:hypothetical protein